MLQDVGRIDARFGAVVRLPADGPGEMLGIAPARGAGGDEQLRHLHGVHVFLDRRVGRGAERREDQEHLVALDQLARLLHRLRRAVGVVIGDEVDLAAVDAAIVVDHAEIGAHRLADDAVGRGRPAVRHDVADLDLGVGDAGVVFLLRGSGRGGCGEDQSGSPRVWKGLTRALKKFVVKKSLSARFMSFLLRCGQGVTASCRTVSSIAFF